MHLPHTFPHANSMLHTASDTQRVHAGTRKLTNRMWWHRQPWVEEEDRGERERERKREREREKERGRGRKRERERDIERKRGWTNNNNNNLYWVSDTCVCQSMLSLTGRQTTLISCACGKADHTYSSNSSHDRPHPFLSRAHLAQADRPFFFLFACIAADQAITFTSILLSLRPCNICSPHVCSSGNRIVIENLRSCRKQK